MPTFYVNITGHLDVLRKPAELPDAIHQVYTIDVDSPLVLAQRVANELKDIVQCGGMVASLQPFERVIGAYDKRVWVPLQMITYIDTEIRTTTQEMPQPDLEHQGEFIDKQGNKARKM